jgi:hypothetical protein
VNEAQKETKEKEKETKKIEGKSRLALYDVKKKKRVFISYKTGQRMIKRKRGEKQRTKASKQKKFSWSAGQQWRNIQVLVLSFLCLFIYILSYTLIL